MKHMERFRKMINLAIRMEWMNNALNTLVHLAHKFGEGPVLISTVAED